ncbi:MAG: helix-turn-helix transcriptional regulator [Paludibacteraceae bacterium]|nr:helix-turn-helix transcriptional regulator [Paludibacteraceae bacterium]
MQQIDEHSNKNRLKVVLAEQNKSGKWLALQLGKTENTISRWVRNINQPTVEQLFDIAKILNVDVKTLLNSNN